MSELLTGMISTCVVSIVVAKFQHFEMLILHLSQSSALCLDSPDHIIFITMILSKSCQTDTPCWPELEQNYKYNHVWIMLWPCLISSLSLHPAVVQLCCVSSGPDLVWLLLKLCSRPLAPPDICTHLVVSRPGRPAGNLDCFNFRFKAQPLYR